MASLKSDQCKRYFMAKLHGKLLGFTNTIQAIIFELIDQHHIDMGIIDVSNMDLFNNFSVHEESIELIVALVYLLDFKCSKVKVYCSGNLIKDALSSIMIPPSFRNTEFITASIENMCYDDSTTAWDKF